MIFLNKKTIGSIITIMMLVVVSTAGVFYLDDTVQLYKDNLVFLTSAKSIEKDFEIASVKGTDIFLINDFKDDLKINSIKIGNKTCLNPKNILIDSGSYIKVDIGGCTLNLGQIAVDVSVYTDYGIKSEYEILRDSPTSSFVVVSQMGVCDISSGYVGLYSIDTLDNAHAGTYLSTTYNICARHLDYTLGSASTGNFINLFYLTNTSNSAVFTSKGTIYQAPSQWYNITISSSSGTFDYQINSTDLSGSGYSCIGAIFKDDVYGSHIGTCNSVTLTDKLWVKLS